MAAETVTRFAPSPTGRLHLGHVYSALFAEAEAKRAGGRFLLRIEDIDAGRCRPEFETAIYDDLAWLGLAWERPVRRQSEHFADYAGAIGRLEDLGLLYPCFCTRKEIIAEIDGAQRAPHGLSEGADHSIVGPLYPGICRRLTETQRQEQRAAGRPFALRLDSEKAVAATGPLRWTDRDAGEIQARPELFGDAVLARKDIPASYHIAVTVDDHLQGVSLVTRGDDLAPGAHLHCLLQVLLGFDRPDYRHHRMITGADGKYLAKRDNALTIATMRRAGSSPADIRAMAGVGSL